MSREGEASLEEVGSEGMVAAAMVEEGRGWRFRAFGRTKARWQGDGKHGLLGQGVVWRMSRVATRTSQTLATTVDKKQM